jgi:ABC-type uncharacterized transport system ATPase subunit
MDPMDLRPGEGVWLSRLKVTNFRSIGTLDLEFRHRLTVLIGDNGAGKTTVLDSISLLLRPVRQAHPYGWDVTCSARCVGVRRSRQRFAEKDVEEARQVRESRDLAYRHPQLESVRRAVSGMIPGTSNLRIDPATLS